MPELMDITSLQATLDEKRQELARLETELKTARESRLPKLAEENGFDSIDALIVALSTFATPGLKEVIESAIRPANARAVPTKHRRKRARITAQMRKRIAGELRKGTRTSHEIAAAFDVSPSFVNAYKRCLGLTNQRGIAAL